MPTRRSERLITAFWPAEGPDATRPEQRRRLRRIGHHRQVQPEPAADPERRTEKGVLLVLIGEPIGAHQPRRLR
jgi:hypothetical protein